MAVDRVANFNKIMSKEHARWHHIRSHRSVDLASRFAELPRGKTLPKNILYIDRK